MARGPRRPAAFVLALLPMPRAGLFVLAPSPGIGPGALGAAGIGGAKGPINAPIKASSPSKRDEVIVWSAFHPYPGLGVLHEGIQVLFDLGDAQDLCNRGRTGFDLIPTVGAQGAHAEINRALSNRGCRGPIQNERAQRLVQD